MKKLFLVILTATLAITACGQKDLKPWTEGGFETHKYRSVFAEMGYSQAEIDAKLESIFQEVFYGPDKVFFDITAKVLKCNKKFDKNYHKKVEFLIQRCGHT